MAAMKLLVTPLSRPAKNIFLQRPQKSPSINPACRFLLNPNPKPNHPNPVHGLGFGFPSTKTRPFSNKPESDRRQHWQTEYRRHLGINDSPVLLHQDHFQPPKYGEVKINFSAALAENHFDDDVDGVDDPSARTGGIGALARNSLGDVLGVAKGYMKYSWRNKLELQLYALKAAVNLAKALEHRGMHGVPVVYESCSHALVTALFHDGCEGEPEEVLRRLKPRDEDLEEVGRSCPIYLGPKEDLKDMLPPNVFDVLFDLVEKEKAHTALEASKVSSQAHLEHNGGERRYACILRGNSVFVHIYSTCSSVWPGETNIFQV